MAAFFMPGHSPAGYEPGRALPSKAPRQVRSTLSESLINKTVKKFLQSYLAAFLKEKYLQFLIFTGILRAPYRISINNGGVWLGVFIHMLGTTLSTTKNEKTIYFIY
jgi:hypothetical protein